MSIASPTLNNQTFDFICDFVRDKSAIVVEPTKSYLVESRLNPVARDNGMASLDELVDALKRPGNRELARQVIDAMTTNESSFFRDLQPFEALKSEIIPGLLEKRAKERTLNIWSNACSSGQEIYSIAMLLRESFPALASWKVRLIASDLSTAILKKAQAGVFSQTEVNRGLPMPMLLKYFTKQGLQWQIREDLRNAIEFREMNLIEAWPTNLPVMDIVFLRNVLIYFSTDTKTEILRKVQRILRPDGCLFLGGAETTMNLDTKFVRVSIGKTAYYRQET
jgi:chemotaxis protein methyltransferase CheR